MVFWQLTFDANDPGLLARFWAQALGYQPAPPADPQTTWHQHYRARLGEEAAFDDRLFDPAGLRPPIWFQEVPEAKGGKNRLHLDLYPTGRDNALPLKRRIEIVEAKVAELTGLGASVERRTRHDDPDDPSTTWSCAIRRATNSASAEPAASGPAGQDAVLTFADARRRAGVIGLWCPTYDAHWACPPRQTFRMTGSAGRPLLIDGSTARPPRCRNRR